MNTILGKKWPLVSSNAITGSANTPIGTGIYTRPTRSALSRKMLDINRGNRFVSLVSMASKSVGMREWTAQNPPEGNPLFTQGDVVTTMILCARGETILLIHDTTLPRPYSRALRVQGSRGLYMEDTQSVHIEGKTEHEKWDSIESYRETYEHPLWKSYLAEGGARGTTTGWIISCSAASSKTRKRRRSPDRRLRCRRLDGRHLPVRGIRRPGGRAGLLSGFHRREMDRRHGGRHGTVRPVTDPGTKKRTASRSLFYQNNPDQSTLYFCSATATRRKYSALML